MASGWDQAQKKVIRNNGRNTGSSLWDQDAVASQDIDSAGHDTNDNTLADSISETLHIGGYNNMQANLNFGSFKGVALADGVDPTDAVTKQQLDAVTGGTYLSLDGSTPMEANLPMGGFKVTDIAVGTDPTDGAALSQVTAVDAKADANASAITVLQGQSSYLADEFRSNGLIRHVLNKTTTINVGVNRHKAENDGGLTLTFTGLPAPGTSDPSLGDDYQIEGQVVIWNSATPGTITVNGMTGARIIGAPDESTADAAQVLTYLIQHEFGGNSITLVWSA